MLADSAQTLINIYGSDVTNYLSTRASQGFTAIQFDLVAASYVRATYPYGATSASGAVYAFSDHGAITSGYATNPASWTLMDSYVGAINALGTDGVSDLQTWLAFLKSINWWTLQPDFGRALATTGSTGWNRASLVGTGRAYNWDAYISQAADSLTGGAYLHMGLPPQRKIPGPRCPEDIAAEAARQNEPPRLLAIGDRARPVAAKISHRGSSPPRG